MIHESENQAAKQPSKSSAIYERSAGVVLFRQLPEHREYLILHYPGGHFDLPKGHVEKGENDREAAYRELIEETGIEKIVWIEGYRETIHYNYYRGPQLMSKDVIFFLARTRQKKVIISHEHRGFDWVLYEEAVKTLTFENAKRLVRVAEKFLKNFVEPSPPNKTSNKKNL